ncbi:MAG: porphobilinogen synthase [Alphaproteobacteria bacterium]|nr:porphobilinogen synthase [Alphaproteobacteria bacterium]
MSLESRETTPVNDTATHTPKQETPEKPAAYPQLRLRRLRAAPWIRDMVQETHIRVTDLIWPVFVTEGTNIRQPVTSMPDVERLSIDLLSEEVKEAAALGIRAIALFPVVPAEKKTPQGAEALNPNNLICRAITALKKSTPDMGIIADVALDPYTDHGHDGLLRDGKIINDETVAILCQQALIQARAGADVIAPSDMMDGRIGAIRKTLDSAGFQELLLLSYAAKYASGFYGPFRDAVNSAPFLKGDKKTYQMNPANGAEALREVVQDIAEGADMVMVKPGLPYLDIITRIKTTLNIPTFAYQVSGEYAMIKAAAAQGWLDYDSCLLETLMSFKRAGCDGILTYGAHHAARLLRNNY